LVFAIALHGAGEVLAEDIGTIGDYRSRSRGTPRVAVERVVPDLQVVLDPFDRLPEAVVLAVGALAPRA
jgi:hypothetical protein